MFKLDVQDSLDDNYWRKLDDNASRADYPELLNRLTDLACLDPFVARGILTNYELLGDKPPSLEKIELAYRLVKAVGIDCPGLKGVTEISMVRLRKWASRAENESRSMVK